MSRFWAVVWVLLAALATIAGIQAQAQWGEQIWVPLALVVIWLVTAAGLLFEPARKLLAAPLRWLRRRPVLYWIALLLYLTVTLGAWVVVDQPTHGRPVTALESIYLLLVAWGLVYLLAFAMDSEQARAMGRKIGSSKWAGVMVTLTTVLVLFAAAEAWLRVNYVTTDAYGFTAMNYHWYNNFYWGRENSLGYRDYEPREGADLTRIAVVGDSFAVGHGINDIDDSFPQLLEQQLGDGYDVNLVAESGWDSDVELGFLMQYPYQPDIVVLSYYLNDIDWLLRETPLNPDSNFQFPDNPALEWFVLNFFAPNYVYYNLLQFTSQARNSNFIGDLIGAYQDDAIWSQQVVKLDEMAWWSRENDVRLIVLAWPSIVAIDESAPAVGRVAGFFRDQGVEVIDMSDHLRGREPTSLIVNRFDTHPGIEAQKLAADALYQTITSGGG